ncbi:MAG TPA: DNA-binding protein [Patescibacteria group bacterium]|nr:DNA-binding protein [Patescibacteria group bacterium]
MSPRLIDQADLVDVHEIARRAGVVVATVYSWRIRQPSFPRPVVRTSGGSVWDWQEIESWLPSLRVTRPRGRTAR